MERMNWEDNQVNSAGIDRSVAQLHRGIKSPLAAKSPEKVTVIILRFMR